MHNRILIIDDDELLLGFMVEHLTMMGYEITSYVSPVEAKNYLINGGSDKTDLVISDVKMNEMSGDELHTYVSSAYPQIGIILMTGFGNVNHAVNAMRKGAFDYITKPFNAKEISIRVNHFFKVKEAASKKSTGKLNVSLANTQPELSSHTELVEKKNEAQLKFIGKEPAIIGLLNILPAISRNDAPVLIQGDSGTGKEVFARQIHTYSLRRNKPYIKINCANLPTELVESTLFGHIKGAFTGAIADRKGAFDEAYEGTLLLDEITEIDINVQAKLLRVLQEKEFNRVGSQKPIKTDVRIIATSNRNITQTINDGHFREDLYYRLNVFPIKIPSLKERRGDIPLLVTHFLNLYTSRYNLKKKTVSEELMNYFLNHEWRGNVRELENIIHRGVILSHNSEIIEKQHIDNTIFSNVSDELGIDELTDLPLMSIEEMELQLIKKAMEYTRGNQKRAAEILGITDRTIRNKLKNLQFGN